MTEYINILKKKLFCDIDQKDIESMMKCLNLRKKDFKKGDMVIWEGDKVTEVGIIISGEARSLKFDFSGKAVIITLLETGSFIGILLTASKGRVSPVSVQAQTDLSVLFIAYNNIIGICKNTCHCHKTLLTNFLDSLAEKALVLHDRNDCLIKTSLRDKVLTYLIKISKDNGSKTFDIPLDRQGMAEYLNTERSALSRELSKMKKERLIDFYKYSFKLLI